MAFRDFEKTFPFNAFCFLYSMGIACFGGDPASFGEILLLT